MLQTFNNLHLQLLSIKKYEILFFCYDAYVTLKTDRRGHQAFKYHKSPNINQASFFNVSKYFLFFSMYLLVFFSVYFPLKMNVSNEFIMLDSILINNTFIISYRYPVLLCPFRDRSCDMLGAGMGTRSSKQG